MSTVTAEAEVTLPVMATVELDHGEFCDDPQVIFVDGIPFPRGSAFYDLIMRQVRADMEQDIRDKQRNEEIVKKCRDWGGSI